VTLRQDALLRPLDEWLAGKFEPRYLPATIAELIAATTFPEIPARPADAQHELELGACDRKLAQYRAALAWRWAQANRASDGSLPSGSDIGREHGRHERWGRLVKRAGLAGELDPQT